MSGLKFSRRVLLRDGCNLVVAGAFLSGARSHGAETRSVCVDLTASESNPSLRESLNFTEESPYPEKLCSGCAYFVPEDGTPPCGGCQIFSGPTNAGGYCDVWSPKSS